MVRAVVLLLLRLAAVAPILVLPHGKPPKTPTTIGEPDLMPEKIQTAEKGFQEFVAAAYDGQEISEEQMQAGRDVWMNAILWLLSSNAKSVQDQKPPSTNGEARRRQRAREHRLATISLEVGAYAQARVKEMDSHE